MSDTGFLRYVDHRHSQVVWPELIEELVITELGRVRERYRSDDLAKLSLLGDGYDERLWAVIRRYDNHIIAIGFRVLRIIFIRKLLIVR